MPRISPRQLGVLACVIGLLAGPGTVRGQEPEATALREVGSAHVFDGTLGWANPIQCDEDANLYIQFLPHYTRDEMEAAAREKRTLPFIRRKVTRVSPDGKEKTVFDPAVGPKLSSASELTTGNTAVGPDGGLYLLVWATWDEKDGQPERGGQYILSFDKKGKYRSEVEVDHREIGVRQFEVFGSGDFLLLGYEGAAPRFERVAVLEASGGDLRDVQGWGYPAGPHEEGEPPSTDRVANDYLVRGGDGRIYFADQDPRKEMVVYAFEPSGATSEAFTLPRMAQGLKLVGFKAAGDRLAAVYNEPSPDGGIGRFWIAVLNTVAGGEVESYYGPVPGPPACYQAEGSGDRFTLFWGGNVVTIAP